MFATSITAAALTFAAFTGCTAGLDITPVQGDFLQDLAAARAAGITVYEDYTWKGMPDAYADDDLRFDAIAHQGENDDSDVPGIQGVVELDPSGIQVSGASLAERLASLHVLDSQEIAVAKCSTDTDCARYALENGMGFDGESLGLPNGIVVDGYVTTDHGFEPVPFN